MAGFDCKDCAAVITGASSGLGAEFARQLAPRARALMLVARRRQPMEELAGELRAAHPNLRVEVVTADLNEPGAVQRIAEAAKAFQPNLLVNNAGLGDYGRFSSADPQRLQSQMRVNMESLVLLTHALVPLLQRPAGVVNVGSLAGTLPMPELAVYAATKAFVDRFSEALALELAGQGVTVTCLCPGPTPTSFGKTATRESGGDTNREGQDLLRIPPPQVVREGLQALERGCTVHFAGTMVRIAASVFSILPRGILRLLMRRRLASSASQT